MTFRSYFAPYATDLPLSEYKLPRLSPTYRNIVAYPHTHRRIPSPPNERDRQGLLEWRVGVQESLTVGLVEKMSFLKEEMLEQLKFSKKLENQQENHKDFLRNELQALAQSISKMKEEVHDFEENVRDKWQTVNSAAITLRNLENHHTTSLADVRSRITRSDQAINLLSQKIAQLGEELRAMNESHRRDIQEVHGMMKANEQKSGDLNVEVDRTFQRLTQTIQRTQEDLQKQILDLERRLLQQIADTQREIHAYVSNSLGERNQLESRVMESLNEMFNEVEQRVSLAEQRAEEARVDEELEARVNDYEKEMTTFRQQVLNTFKEVEMRMNRLSDELYENHRGLVDAVREEMRQGFCTTHDTISNMKSVLESKIRISEENLQLELGQLRKLVVLT
ncbi:hypothetical protein X801_07301 [Opisthorchis viverrini]|uniref:Uncharacterized protein n=1 Tax=Opisthorchis viverrini TaxID=6198 RepID=A0A1S8WQV9_OPIVI|nr:hypothetical protein X801_07301 [Opisthorchis viverrini]